MPIAVWCLLFATIGAWRMVGGKLSADLAIVATSIFGIGLAVYVATCICNLSQPRYVLPLWVGTVAFGSILIAGRQIDLSTGKRQISSFLREHRKRMNKDIRVRITEE
jgi:hypothetical protein